MTSLTPLRTFAYRVTDFVTTRAALLRARSGEVALRDWHPESEDDIALQLVEWWAYLADILAFYTERALSESYLRSAMFGDDVRRIVRLLGYRPRPGIGATGVVAAITDSAAPFTLPRGFPIQGEGPDGPQIFEVDEDIQIGRLGKPLPRSARFPGAPSSGASWRGSTRDTDGRLLNSIIVPPRRMPKFPPITSGQQVPLSLRGVVASVKPKDHLFFVPRTGSGPSARVEVRAVTPSYNEFGDATTTLTLLPHDSLPSSADATTHRLVRSTKLAHLWTYHFRYKGQSGGAGIDFGELMKDAMDPSRLFLGGGGPPQDNEKQVLTTDAGTNFGAAHLEAIVRGLKAGDEIAFEKTVNGVVTDRLLTRVRGYSELIWYANPPQDGGPPPSPPKKESGGILEGIVGALSFGLLGGGNDDQPPSPMPIPHTRVTFDDPSKKVVAMGNNLADIDKIVVHYSFEEVAQVVDPDELEPQNNVDVPAPPQLPPLPLEVLVEDANGEGAPGFLGTTTTTDDHPLKPPLRALLNLLPVSRGQSVAGEVLGSGDRTVAGQEFVVKRAPVTYLADTSEHAIDGYRSTLRIWVDGIEWHEVRTLYGHGRDERVFVTWEDDEQKTHVKFGDGELGARLPSGADNVVASYRVGSGAGIPRQGSLVTMLRPQPGITQLRNPVPVGGGADPDPPEQIRRYAPMSVLTFGRAISGDDYEAIAAQTPGVRRAKVEWGWDPLTQRSCVRVFVGDDQAAVAAARAALAAFADPNRPISVELASPLYAHVDLVVEVPRDRIASDVAEAVRSALLDPQSDPFGIEYVTIGGAIYNSQIYRACLRVPGVAAVHLLRFGVSRPLVAPLLPFALPPNWWMGGSLSSLRLSPTSTDSSERHVPGPGRFYILRPDALSVVTEVARDGV